VSSPAYTVSANSYNWTGPINNWETVQDGVYGPVLRVKTFDPVERVIESAYKPCKTIEFIIQPQPGSACYAKVKILSKDGSVQKEVWLNINAGNQNPKKTSDVEWGMFVPLKRLESGWISLRANMKKSVAKTFGSDGWRFAEVTGIRLRGPLKMAKVNLYD
jgi:hypothetical protein